MANQIEIYEKSNFNYNSNGDIVLQPSACTYKNSERELYLEHLIDDEGRWEYIKEDNVISVTKNDKKKFYRIYNKIKSLYKVVAYARPIFYDLVDTVILEDGARAMTGQEALDYALKGTGFTGHSNISSINPVSYFRKNVVAALLGDDETSFINTFGGEFYAEGFDIYINDRIGADNGVRVEFGYNLNEIEEDVNIEEVCTRIIPLGANGISLEGDKPWVDSPLLNKYPHPKTRVIEFNDVKVKENANDEEGFDTIELARAELVKRCEQLFKEGIDQPLVNYKIDMINLANTTAYENFIPLVDVGEGDTVHCYIPHLDISVSARAIDFEEDLINDEYISLELGNVINNYIKEQADIQHRLNAILNDKGQVKTDVLNGIINALNVKFKALRDVAQPQEVLAMIFEDRVENSPTFGAMCLGTMGFMIASSFKPGTQDWDFRTFGTGKGFVADFITAGVLNANLVRTGNIRSSDGKVDINLDNGAFTLKNDNGEVIIDGSSRIFKIKHVFEREYTAPQSAPEFRSNFVHNLGYVPVYLAYQVDTVSTMGDRTNTLLPASTIVRNTATNTIDTKAIIRCNADENNIIVQYYRADLTQPNTFKVKFFILEERLL